MKKIDYIDFCKEHPATSSTKKELENIYNRVLERDPYNNEIMWTFLDDLFQRYTRILDSEEKYYPKDNLMLLSDYLFPPFQKIVMSPKTQLVKNNILQKHYKIQTINSKTMQWLEGKSGKTLKEKVGNTGKVMAPLSSYTVDKKENRIVTHLFKKMEEILESKYSELSILDIYENTELKRVYENFHRMKKIMKDNKLYYLDKPKDFTPNNILIDHRDYSKIFRGLKIFNKCIENYGSSQEYTLKNAMYIIFLGICSRLGELKNIELLNYDIELPDIFDTNKIFSQEFSFIFTENSNITKRILLSFIDSIEQPKINFKLNWKCNKKTNLDITFDLRVNIKNKSGIMIFCPILQMEFILNKEGIKNVIETIFKAIVQESKISSKKILTSENKKIIGNTFLNFFTPATTINRKQFMKSVYYTKRGVLLDQNRYYDIGKISSSGEIVKNISNILSLSEDGKNYEGAFSKFSEVMSRTFEQKEGSVTIYSMAENIEEGISDMVYSSIKRNFKESVPVWRSILIISNPKIGRTLESGEEVFVLDLNNPNISLNKVKKNKGILEHHPKIFIESEISGLSVTDFMKDYLEQFIIKNKIILNSSEKEYILNSYKFYEIIFENLKKYNFFKEGLVISIEYDRNILESLEREYTEKVSKFLNDEVTKEEQKKNIHILGNHLFSKNKKLNNNIFIWNESSLFSGYEVILKKVINEETLWNEYLPNLSLETEKGKHFYKLELIKNKSLETRLGKSVSFDVDEELELSPIESKTEYLFQIFSENYSEKKDYFLRVKSEKNFPLNSPINLKLKIIYSYGQIEPYKFIIEPRNGIINDFKVDIIQKKFVLNIKIPVFPSFNKIEKTRIISLLESLNESFKNQILGESKFNLRELKYLLDTLKEQRNKNIIRNYLRASNNQEIDALEFENHPFIKNCLVKFLNGELERANLLNNDLNEKQKEEIESLFMGFINSFGAYTSNFLPENIIRKLDKKRLLNFAFSSGNIELVLSLYLNSEGNYNYYRLYADIAYASWIEKDFIMEFYEKYPNIIKECLKIVRKELFNLNQEFFDRIKKIEISQRKIYYRETNKFKDSLKLLLAIFRLNLNEDKLTQLGLRKHTVKQLISLIKEIDRKIRVENNNEKLIKDFDQDKTPNLQLEKPIELSNMSNLAYATYLYLIGDNKADLISIRESDDE